MLHKLDSREMSFWSKESPDPYLSKMVASESKTKAVDANLNIKSY